MRTPDFGNIQKILQKQKPDRFTPFEYYMNTEVYDYFTQGTNLHASADPVENGRYLIEAFRKAGYDYAHMSGGRFQFRYRNFETLKSQSLNDGAIIEDEESDFNRDARLLQMGILNDWEFRMKWMNEDETTAKAALPRMEELVSDV